MSSFQDIVDIPLIKILGYLDTDSRKNLLKATELTDIGLRMVEIQPSRLYACPECAIHAGPRNLNDIDDWKVTEAKSTSPYEPARMDEIYDFNFFSQFRHMTFGNSNYKFEVQCVDEDENLIYTIRSRHDKVENYEAVKFLCNDYDEHNSLFHSNFVEVLKNAKDKKSYFDKEKARLQRMFLGGKYLGATVKPRMKLYTREEFKKHVFQCHVALDLQSVDEFEEWADKYADPTMTFPVSNDWYMSWGVLETEEVEDLITRVTIARYYRFITESSENIADALGDKDDYLWKQIDRIFQMSKEVFASLRFHRKCPLQTDLSLFKFYDMYAKAFDAVRRC